MVSGEGREMHSHGEASLEQIMAQKNGTNWTNGALGILDSPERQSHSSGQQGFRAVYQRAEYPKTGSLPKAKRNRKRHGGRCLHILLLTCWTHLFPNPPPSCPTFLKKSACIICPSSSPLAKEMRGGFIKGSCSPGCCSAPPTFSHPKRQPRASPAREILSGMCI